MVCLSSSFTHKKKIKIVHSGNKKKGSLLYFQTHSVYSSLSLESAANAFTFLQGHGWRVEGAWADLCLLGRQLWGRSSLSVCWRWQFYISAFPRWENAVTCLPNPGALRVLERGQVAASDFLRSLDDVMPPGSVTLGGCLRWAPSRSARSAELLSGWGYAADTDGRQGRGGSSGCAPVFAAFRPGLFWPGPDSQLFYLMSAC